MVLLKITSSLKYLHYEIKTLIKYNYMVVSLYYNYENIQMVYIYNIYYLYMISLISIQIVFFAVEYRKLISLNRRFTRSYCTLEKI